MKLPQRLSTERLELRPATIEDADAVFGYASDPGVSRYLPWRPHASREDTIDFLRRCEQDWRDGSAFPWVIVEAGRVVGMIEAGIDGYRASLGYVLASDAWGRGIATEAVEAVVGALLELPELWRVWATCDVENRASARVLEKAGFSFEGVLHRWDRHNVGPEPRDARVYAIWRNPSGEWGLR